MIDWIATRLQEQCRQAREGKPDLYQFTLGHVPAATEIYEVIEHMLIKTITERIKAQRGTVEEGFDGLADPS